MDKQDLLNSFYNIDNLVTIAITIPDAQWQALKSAEPRGGRCNFGYVGDRFDWYTATSINISGTSFPKPGNYNFPNVGVIKKSYCGSFSTTKPSLRLNFSKTVKANEASVENLIGTHELTLNNSIQDSSYIRQTLGYELFRQAGLPYSRCNFVKVVVNGVSQGLYINMEPFKKTYMAHKFHGNDKGNAYELEVGEDLDLNIINANKVSFEGFTDFTDQKDLKLAASQIATGGLAAANQVVDMDEFIKFFAMETLLKHWDGYTSNRNNTFVYNDTVAVANPTVANVKLKFMPSGIDQILQEGRDFHAGGSSILSTLVRGDAAATARFFSAIRNYANTVFSATNYDTVLKPLMDKLEALVKTTGVTDASSSIATVRKQIKLVRAGAFQLISEFPKDAPMLLAQSSGDCIHASNSEFIPNQPNNPQEVYHCPPTNVAADKWAVKPSATAGNYKFKNAAYGTWLHCDGSVKTPGGHLNVYAVRTDPTPGNEFKAEGVNVKQWWATGYFRIKNAQTNNYVCFSDSDLTPKGNKEVIQGGAGDAATLFLF